MEARDRGQRANNRGQVVIRNIDGLRMRVEPIPDDNAPIVNGNWSHSISDPNGRRLFVFSGALRNGWRLDFRVFNFVTNAWRDLTGTLHTRGNIFGGVAPITFPALNFTAPALATIDNTDFLFLFGGFNAPAQSISSKLYAINVTNGSMEEGRWKELDVGDGPDVENVAVQPRTNAAMAALTTDTTRLYIFGGRSSDEGNAAVLDTFSICEMRRDEQDVPYWVWIKKDVEYSACQEDAIPSLGYNCEAVSLYDGGQIMLTIGQSKPGTFDLDKNRIVMFNPSNITFQEFKNTIGEPMRKVTDYFPFAVSTSDGDVPDAVLFMGHRSDPEFTLGLARRRNADDKKMYEWYMWLYRPFWKGTIEYIDVRKALWDLKILLATAIVQNGKVLLLGTDDVRTKDARYNKLVEIALTDLINLIPN